jgi:hypothetical protein
LDKKVQNPCKHFQTIFLQLNLTFAIRFFAFQTILLNDKDDKVSLWPEFPLTVQNSHQPHGGLQRAMTDIYIIVNLQEGPETENASTENDNLKTGAKQLFLTYNMWIFEYFY